ncbi:hypothetical protein ID866_8798 [Astraeus odoratus]|nr:hypothetical protein ID866_8798 [Astraeus odoratus]
MEYPCCLWAKHVEQTEFCILISQSVEALLQGVKILFWLEVLSLLRCINITPSSLAAVARWIQGGSCEDTVASLYDVIKFIQLFGSVMEKSTPPPHLYLSALAFFPEMSILASKVGSIFPNIAQVAVGNHQHWPSLQNVCKGHSGGVWSVTFFSDGRRIASGSNDQAVCFWDAETSIQMGNPLQGHTRTICLWNSETGVQIGNLFQGHTDTVCSVAFSPDGRRIILGSVNKTNYLWDVKTEKTTIIRMQSDGWIVGRNGPALLWIPITHYPFLYHPHSILIIPGNIVELDLSRMAHGSKWQQCFLIHNG